MEVFSQQLHLEAPLLKGLQTALGIEHFRDFGISLLEIPNSEGFFSRKSDFIEMYEPRSLKKSVI